MAPSVLILLLAVNFASAGKEGWSDVWPNGMIWDWKAQLGHIGCPQITCMPSTKDNPVTVEECMDKCDSTDGCNAIVNHRPPDDQEEWWGWWGVPAQCCLRKCPVPDPKQGVPPPTHGPRVLGNGKVYDYAYSKVGTCTHIDGTKHYDGSKWDWNQPPFGVMECECASKSGIFCCNQMGICNEF